MNPLPDPTEQQWLAAMRAGREDALRQIFNRHYPLLLGDIYRIVPDEDTCKDLAQEVFVDLWRKREELDIHSSLRAYLRRAAVNRALNYLKTHKNNLFNTSDEDLVNTADTSPQEKIHQDEQEEMEQVLQAALNELPEKCRIVFSLSRFEQLSHKEIAEQLGISVKTIENQITKAMKILREILLRHRNLSPIVILWLNYWIGA